MAKAFKTKPCTREEACARLAAAGQFVAAAERSLKDGEKSPAATGVAVANAVLAGIAASDAACCAKLKKHPRGQDHREATKVLSTVEPSGVEMAKDLGRLLAEKDNAHYGTKVVSPAMARRLVGYAKRLVADAAVVISA